MHVILKKAFSFIENPDKPYASFYFQLIKHVPFYTALSYFLHKD